MPSDEARRRSVVLVEDRLAAVCVERQAREDLEQQAAERVDVGGAGDVARIAQLLRGHVGERAEHRTVARRLMVVTGV